MLNTVEIIWSKEDGDEELLRIRTLAEIKSLEVLSHSVLFYKTCSFNAMTVKNVKNLLRKGFQENVITRVRQVYYFLENCTK